MPTFQVFSFGCLSRAAQYQANLYGGSAQLCIVPILSRTPAARAFELPAEPA